MKYIGIIYGPLSALSIILLTESFWWLRVSNYSTELALLWGIVWLATEIVWLVYLQGRVPRLLSHLRWGPFVVLFVALTVVTAFDQLNLLYSRHQLRQYIYYGAEYPSPMSNLLLYNNYRGWCGNGGVDVLYNNYIDTTREGFESEDPAIRKRALETAIYLSLGSTDDRFLWLIDKARFDFDPTVQAIARNHRLTYR